MADKSTPSEQCLNDDDELLFRQIHPQFMTNGRISSQAFAASASHQGKLSVDRQSLTTPQESYELYTMGFKKASCGVYGLSVGEVRQNDLSAFPDPLEADANLPANPAHAVVDMQSLSVNKMRKVAKKLAKMARTRGALYRP